MMAVLSVFFCRSVAHANIDYDPAYAAALFCKFSLRNVTALFASGMLWGRLARTRSELAIHWRRCGRRLPAKRIASGERLAARERRKIDGGRGNRGGLRNSFPRDGLDTGR